VEGPVLFIMCIHKEKKKVEEEEQCNKVGAGILLYR
jgi:hypothetical protein